LFEKNIHIFTKEFYGYKNEKHIECEIRELKNGNFNFLNYKKYINAERFIDIYNKRELRMFYVFEYIIKSCNFKKFKWFMDRDL